MNTLRLCDSNRPLSDSIVRSLKVTRPCQWLHTTPLGSSVSQHRQHILPVLSARRSRSKGSSIDNVSTSTGRADGDSQPIAGAASGAKSSSRSSSNSSTTSTTSSSRRVELPPPCDLGGAEPQARWNAVSLAYLGDAVWEAYLRSYFYGHGGLSGSQLYNSRVAAKANTHAQAACYNLLLAEGWPSADEASLMRWAANSNVVSPPKHANRQLYKQATALEALVAYLYLKDGQRLYELMDWLLDEQRVVVWRSDIPQPAQSSAQATPPQQQGGRRRRGASQ